MSSRATDRNLQKAKIIILEGRHKNEEISFQFNPGEYSIEKGMNYGEQQVAGVTTPLTQFVSGESETLSMELFFDVTENQDIADVRSQTDRLDLLLEIDRELHAPPKCRFVWGTLEFKAVMERASKRFTMFSRDGTPLRARADVAFSRYRTPAEQAQSNPKQSADRTTVREVGPGDSLPLIAAEEYGDATAWRPIADANDIETPRDVEPGTTLVIPTLE